MKLPHLAQRLSVGRPGGTVGRGLAGLIGPGWVVGEIGAVRLGDNEPELRVAELTSIDPAFNGPPLSEPVLIDEPVLTDPVFEPVLREPVFEPVLREPVFNDLIPEFIDPTPGLIEPIPGEIPPCPGVRVPILELFWIPVFRLPVPGLNVLEPLMPVPPVAPTPAPVAPTFGPLVPGAPTPEVPPVALPLGSCWSGL